jgi:hypothetical protein
MNKTKLYYKQKIMNNFFNNYGISKKDLTTDSINYFRYICYRYNEFIKSIPLPSIPIKSFYETVLIEFRIFPHLEFLIRNCILKLGEKWCHTIICGNLNYKFIFEMCQNISPNINVIKVNIDNMSQNLYNKFLTSISFWNMLHGEKILIYQEDSIMFHKKIKPFLKYDYIGAPFPKTQNDTPNCVGNGGFSLRSRSIMIKILNTVSVKNTSFNSSTVAYMLKQKLSFPPEDIYYSKNIQELGIGNIADYETASMFSSESIFNDNSLGGHKFWISNINWKQKLKNVFKYSYYTPKSDIKKYLEFGNLNNCHNKTDVNKNAFDIDLKFCNLVNNLLMDNDSDIIKYIQMIGINGYIYHPKQITNIFPQIIFYTFLDNIFIMYKSDIYIANDFVNKFLYNITYENMFDIMIKTRYYNLNRDIPLLLLVFIGNEERGNDLINRIIQYKEIQEFNISFCFNVTNNFTEKLKNKIKNNFNYYSIYECKECGTDITPTMLMYDDIIKKDTFKHIIKLQTKSIVNQYNDLTTFILSRPIEKLKLLKQDNCNCIGHPNYYLPLDEDKFNNDLKLRYLSEIDVTKSFVGGTIFYCPVNIFDKTLNFMKKSFKHYLFNNLYENNSINIHNSPIHFLERVFGSVHS